MKTEALDAQGARPKPEAVRALVPRQYAHRKELKQGVRRLAVLYEGTNDVVANVHAQHDVTCRKGCAHCCYQMQTITLGEALGALLYLLSTPGGAAFYAERARVIGEQSMRLFDPGVNIDSWFLEKRPCVFLDDDDTCRVYPMRPMVCRMHMVVSDPGLCSIDRPAERVAAIDMRHLYGTWMMYDMKVAQAVGTAARGLHPLPFAVLLAMEFLMRGDTGVRAVLAKAPAEIPIDAPEKFWAKLELGEDGKTYQRSDDGHVRCVVCKAVEPSAEFDATMKCSHCGFDHADNPITRVMQSMRTSTEGENGG